MPVVLKISEYQRHLVCGDLFLIVVLLNAVYHLRFELLKAILRISNVVEWLVKSQIYLRGRVLTLELGETAGVLDREIFQVLEHCCDDSNLPLTTK